MRSMMQIGKWAAITLGSMAASAALGAGIASLTMPPAQIHPPAKAETVAAAQTLAKPAPKAVAKPAAAPQPDETYVIKRILPIDGPMHHGDWYWNDTGVPAGPVIITVDLKAQVLSIFRSGYEIGTAVVLYGADAKPTPLGVYPITQKDAHHISNLYDAPMPYMLRLTNDGVSIHGSMVEDGYMTHGCIGVPTPFAKKLFGAVKLGDRVIVTKGETLDKGKPIKAA